MTDTDREIEVMARKAGLFRPEHYPEYADTAPWHATPEQLARFAALVQARAPLTDAEASALRREWFGHRDTEHLSFAQAVRETMPKLPAEVEHRALEPVRMDAARWRWLRDNFTTDSRACGLHACETPQRLDAHIDAARGALIPLPNAPGAPAVSAD